MTAFLRNFVASVLGGLVVLALVVAGLLALVLASPAPDPEPGSVLTIDLGTAISDRGGEPAPLDMVLSGAVESLPLRRVTAALEAAADDHRIEAVFVHGAGRFGTATLEALREGLAACTAAGKTTLAWLEQPDEGDLYLASACGQVWVAPLATVEWNGLAFELLYWRDLLDSLGIEMQVTRAGKYKSAVEPYLTNEISPANREQLAALGEDLAAVILDGAAAGRGRDPAALRELTEQAPFLTAGQAAEAGLIDGELPFDAVLDRLAEAVGAAADDLPQIDLADWIEVCGRDEPRPRPGRSVVAVAYAEGEIVDGESDSEVGGATLARELRRLRNDPDVAAVVLRVNSPGGSAAASERIRREIELLREVKPVVVSMGDLAASGGYWISCTADRIFARPGTITGSIGVFGVFPNVAGLADKAGVSPQVVRIGEHADADSPWRRKSEAELGAIQAEVDAVYEAFLDRVAAGRGLDREVVHEIGQGRVWSGRAALELGLVDDLGGLDAAIAAAAEAAGLDRDYAVRWPAGQGGLFERLLAELEQEEQPLAGSEAVVIRRLAGGAAAAARLAAAGRVQARPPFRIDARF